MKNKAFHGYAYLITAALLWGGLGPFTSFLLRQGYSSLTVSSIRAPVATFLLGALLLLRKKPIRIPRGKDILLFFCMGTFGLFGNYFSVINAFTYIGVPLAITISYLSPVFVLFFAFFLFGEKITAGKLVSVVIIFVGCAIASGVLASSLSVSWIGLALAASGALTYAFYSICLRGALKRYSSLEATFYAIVGAVPISLLCLAQNPIPPMPLPMNVLLVIQGCLAPVPYLIYGLGIAICGSGISSIFSTLELPFSTLLSYLLLQEEMGAHKIIGISLVTLASIIMGMTDTHSGQGAPIHNKEVSR